ncbi:porin [Xylophilus rhododendri]|uniref:Porin n=1 Tax=Xylophilus rhododendri TaxID=2697032 RepID=A0A857J4N0_9BURK|nr:porin [Xylophilus rhododendri]QHI98920.1 porin [Xylophilus rhododendri]
MKKTLVAIAALTASLGAFAQSNVTLFGVLDASLARISSGGSHVTGLATGDQTSSRLGFRGTEDLGGGLSAGFWLEGGVTLDNGGGTGSGTGFGFERRSTLSLAGNFGEVRLGRDKTPQYLNIETFDPFADIGVGGVGASNMIGSTSTATGTPEGSAPKRASNSVQYILPASLGGFYGQAMYAFGEQASNVANDDLRNSFGLRGGYMAGPLNLALAYGEVTGGTTTTESKFKSTNLGASYNFGMVKPMVQYAQEKGLNRKMDMYLIGATAPLGAGELRVAFSTIQRKDLDNADSKKLAIGYGYNLSKRTQVYATIARVSNDGAAARGLAVSSSSLASPTIANGANVTGYELGLRHSF